MKKATLALSVAALAAAALAIAGTAIYAEGPKMAGMAHHMMMDPMGDKTVTRVEAAAKAGDMFDKLDANHDGKLDKADREAREAAHFDKMDADHNGSISRDEFMAAHRMGEVREGQMRNGGMRHPGAMMAMFHMADTNKDNALSKDEFTAAALKRFDMADANHDGKLTPDERKAARAKMRARMGQRRGEGRPREMGGMEGMDHSGPMDDMPPPQN
ncbi:MAG: EF-hand domain-containing protein [Novosphingobium sp.]